ncbi:helix-turn-helix domain-containing protein [Streptomyces niveus]
MSNREVAPQTDVLPRLYRPEEIAEALGCSAWWVKDRARRRLIPATRVGRAYRFTAGHLAEIIRLNEERPAHTPRPSANRAEPRATSQPTAPERRVAVPSAGLKARPPRRTQQGTFSAAA